MHDRDDDDKKAKQSQDGFSTVWCTHASMFIYTFVISQICLLLLLLSFININIGHAFTITAVKKM